MYLIDRTAPVITLDTSIGANTNQKVKLGDVSFATTITDVSDGTLQLLTISASIIQRDSTSFDGTLSNITPEAIHVSGAIDHSMVPNTSTELTLTGTTGDPLPHHY